jgi:hypothetical protein
MNLVTCTWTQMRIYDEDSGWETKCGEAFMFTDGGTPHDNSFQYCPYCGKPIETVVPEEEIEDE